MAMGSFISFASLLSTLAEQVGNLSKHIFTVVYYGAQKIIARTLFQKKNSSDGTFKKYYNAACMVNDCLVYDSH
jgi:hypothetical protein